jgi:hypothetical protein
MTATGASARWREFGAARLAGSGAVTPARPGADKWASVRDNETTPTAGGRL